jgi:hypothetical protein
MALVRCRHCCEEVPAEELVQEWCKACAEKILPPPPPPVGGGGPGLDLKAASKVDLGWRVPPRVHSIVRSYTVGHRPGSSPALWLAAGGVIALIAIPIGLVVFGLLLGLLLIFEPAGLALKIALPVGCLATALVVGALVWLLVAAVPRCPGCKQDLSWDQERTQATAGQSFFTRTRHQYRCPRCSYFETL